MNKKVNISILFIVVLYFSSTNCNCSENNDNQIEDDNFICTRSNLQNETNIILPGAPHNTNSFLIEHGGDPMFDDDSFSIMYESPIQLFQSNHRENIDKLTQITERFPNKNNYTLNIITNTIKKLNNIYNNIHKNDNNDTIIKQFVEYINILEVLNNKIKDNRSLSLAKQQLITSNQIEDIINMAKMTLDVIKRIDEDQKMLGNISLVL